MQSALAAQCHGDAHGYILWLKKHPGFIHPGDHRTAADWHQTPLACRVESFFPPPVWLMQLAFIPFVFRTELFLFFSPGIFSLYTSTSFNDLCKVPRCPTATGRTNVILSGRQNDGYCWMCKCQRRALIFPSDTCSFRAKTKSCWTLTWPRLCLSVWRFKLLEKACTNERISPATRA